MKEGGRIEEKREGESNCLSKKIGGRVQIPR